MNAPPSPSCWRGRDRPDGPGSPASAEVETDLGLCSADGAAAYIETLLMATLAAWRAEPRDVRGALHLLGQAVTLIARREDL